MLFAFKSTGDRTSDRWSLDPSGWRRLDHSPGGSDPTRIGAKLQVPAKVLVTGNRENTE